MRASPLPAARGAGRCAEAQLCPTARPKDRGRPWRNLLLFSPRPSRAGPSCGMNHKGHGTTGQLELRYRHKDKRRGGRTGARLARQLLYLRLLFPLIRGSGPEAASVTAAPSSARLPQARGRRGVTLLPLPAAPQTGEQ